MPEATTYAEIFDRRAAAYQQAMLEQPGARDAEFETLLGFADLAPGCVVADFPAGGGFLFPYLERRGIREADYFPLETSRRFHAMIDSINAELLDEAQPRLGNERFDCVLSLAGLHHVETRTRYYEHFLRALRPGGRLVIADVLTGSPVDAFLNGFVDQHSELGHRGDFLSADDLTGLTGAGFTEVSGRLEQYPWRFRSGTDRAHYCKLMFGIDAELGEIDEALVALFAPTSCDLPWQLYFVTADKPR